MPQLHPWHDIAPGPDAPQLLEALVEIPRGSRTKYEMDKASGLIRADRVLMGSAVYPVNYGFIPQSMGPDSDPLDILVLSEQAFVPLCLVKVRVIGNMQMTDQGIADDKIIAVPVSDHQFSHYRHVNELPPHIVRELRHFFETYTVLEGKKVTIQNFEGPEAAFSVIAEAFLAYKLAYLKG